MAEFEFRRDKFEQAIMFFSVVLNNGLLGKTKLFKLLYYADFDHFEEYGSPITGETYLRYDFGPFPEHGNITLTGLATQELLKTELVRISDFLQFTYQPIENFDLSVFSPEEVKTLFNVSQKWEKHNAREMVAASHGEAPWIATEPRKSISYSLAYYRNKFGEMDEFVEEDTDLTVKIEEVG